uniref:Transmembrane protein 201 C-terminal domain-containing protein n=1 Tax=Electrophorus electricus TaxID=8005 RepID=A0AAY5ET04_ELEEL
ISFFKFGLFVTYICHFPVHVIVNCWFCNQNTEVPYGNRNCWDCPFCVEMVIITNRSLHNIWSTSTMGYQLVSLCLMHPRLNQTLKIKQLASFTPRKEVGFPFELTITMEIEVYKRHLEQTYELCGPNRQLPALLFNHQLRCSQDADKAFIKVSNYSLRSLAFLTCAFLVAVAICGSGCDSGDTSSLHNSPHTLSGGVIPPKEAHQSDTEAKANSITKTMQMWNDLVGLLPERGNREYQMAVASVGLLTSINIYSVLNTSLLTTSSKRFCSTVCAKSTFPHSSHESWLLLLVRHVCECAKSNFFAWLQAVIL